MPSLRKLSLYIQAVCALAWLLALVGLEALLGLNRRPPVIVRPRKEDAPAESAALAEESPGVRKGVCHDVT
jgi:hypothetical protein